MKQEELDRIVASHQRWLNDEAGEDVQRADLHEKVLREAHLSGADLRTADLRKADLRYADLRNADLRAANLRYADLRYADLRDADLYDADLHRAKLLGADMRDIKNAALCFAQLSICPEVGPFDGWKQCRNGVIVHVRIPEGARRSSATGRKCRAEYVDVIEVIGADCGVSQWNRITAYRVGERVECDVWDDDRWNECSGGIHFYLTRIEAEAHNA